MDPMRLAERVSAFIAHAVRVVERSTVGTHGKAKQEAAVSVFGVWCEEELAHDSAHVFRDPRVDEATRGLIDAYVRWVNTVCAVVRERP